MASTCKSGSEMVMRKPSRKPTPMMRGRLRVLVSMVPIRSPMGVMLISAPRVKNMMPTMIIAAPSRKQSRMLGETGAMEKQSTSTMATMGSTACNASNNFSRSLGMDALRIMSTDLSRKYFRSVQNTCRYMNSIPKSGKKASTKKRQRWINERKIYKLEIKWKPMKIKRPAG